MKKLYGLFLLSFVFVHSIGYCQSGDLKSSSKSLNEPKIYLFPDKVATNCNYEQIGNSLENGYRNDIGGPFEEADDIYVPAGEYWNISQIVSSHFVNGDIASLNVTIYYDAGGLPGSVVENQPGLTSFTSTLIGNNFGYDVYEAVLTLPAPIELYGDASGTTYWLSIMITPVVVGNFSYWESQTVYPYGSNFAQNNGGWSIPGYGNLVFQLIFTVETRNDVTLCYGESIFLEGEYQTEPGTYYDTLTSYLGCDSIVITNLSIEPEIDVSVTLSGNAFTANEASATYQWVDCNDSYAAIPGETNQSFSPILSGSYAVIVTKGFCSDTSDCYYFPDGISTCNYVQIGNNLENGYGNEVGDIEENADDVVIPADQCWNITQIVSSHFVNGDIASLDIKIYDDAGGLPGSVVEEYIGLTSFTSTLIGNNYGYDVYEADATLTTPLELCGGPAGTTYWLSIMVTPIVGGNSSYWESQTIYDYGFDFALNTGGGWYISGYGNLVFQLLFPVGTTNNVTLCYGEGMVLEGEYQTEPGTYYDTLSSSMGCDSVVTTILTIEPEIDITVTVSGNTFTANQDGATYQWVDCNDGNAPIAGETNQSYTPTASGDYAVVITVGSCSVTSDCINYSAGNSVLSNDLTYFTIYPNPTSGQFTIELYEFEDNTMIELYNSLGRIMLKEELISNSQQIDAGKIEKGIYFIKITNEKRQMIEKIVIQ